MLKCTVVDLTAAVPPMLINLFLQATGRNSFAQNVIVF